MTDRVHALTVVLDQDYRTDDVQAIIKTIEMIRGVANVDLRDHITDPEQYYARERVRRDIGQTMLAVYSAICDGRSITIEPEKKR